MPRRLRLSTAGHPHHVLNRACRRDVLFAADEDYVEFLEVLARARRRTTMRVIGFVVMPNHWHLMVCPDTPSQLSRFMHWLTMTQTLRWHRRHRTTGTGPLYQGRYKTFAIRSERHFWIAMRYVERNPVRAGLVEWVEQWRWSSAWHRFNSCPGGLLDEWPFSPPDDWYRLVNEPQNQIHLSAVREAIVRQQSLGA
jgi:putative transposase